MLVKAIVCQAIVFCVPDWNLSNVSMRNGRFFEVMHGWLVCCREKAWLNCEREASKGGRESDLMAGWG